MEYIDYSKYFATYAPYEIKKKEEALIDFSKTYSNLDWTTPLPDLPPMTTQQAKEVKFSDLFDSENSKTPSQLELNQHYTGPISGNLQTAIDKQLNKPYALGGGHNNNLNSKTLDCSGFVSLCFKDAFGIDLNGRARDIYNNPLLTKVNYAQPGDIIFFRGTSKNLPKNVITHVGIITAVDANGNPTKMAHASANQYKKTVVIDYNPNYWNKYQPEIKRLKV